MKRSLRYLTAALVVFVLAMLGGCLETESLLPAKLAVKNDQIIGKFIHQDENIRFEFDISASGKKDLPYKLISNGNNDDPTYFQLFNVDGATLGFFRADNSKEEYSVAKLIISPKQLDVDMVSLDFFKKNPMALPELTTKEFSVITKAKPEQLEAFFKKHGKEIFPGKPAKLTRSGS